MVIKTGCSASLVGLHEACTALRMGHCSAAIVAGTNLIMSPATTAPMTQKGILSPEGSCKASDAAADGLAWGEAISAIYVKKLDDAIRDGNPVRAVIRNTGTNSDGKGSNIPEPNGLSHESLMHNVYRGAGLNVDETAFVEVVSILIALCESLLIHTIKCDGIGTSIGDSIEATAVGKVFEDKGVFIGSVSFKSNVVILLKPIDSRSSQMWAIRRRLLDLRVLSKLSWLWNMRSFLPTSKSMMQTLEVSLMVVSRPLADSRQSHSMRRALRSQSKP